MTRRERIRQLLALRPMLDIGPLHATPGYQVTVPGFRSRFFSYFTYGKHADIAIRHRDK